MMNFNMIHNVYDEPTQEWDYEEIKHGHCIRTNKPWEEGKAIMWVRAHDDSNILWWFLLEKYHRQKSFMINPVQYIWEDY